ncbi:hypothetical protein XMV201_002397 [Aliiroseovarius sp. xm-v-201]|jgi:hypothetical protein|uniref:hypothetical protein n=1 Tax=unclassified Aliiroseovarius TaxID=2623558 RepID=UPI0015693158|nr:MULTISPECIES: hypothetical protein [unclassified Aliiroseovarius]NRP50627.1 hypothetical protein [Aliiroseovarius sp. xm-m-354]NRQ05379.1 hypothetical protein [Aliiroseovarius sp. xm-m-309]NRQ08584.1 hypothetical protein [Aliiroseovarius sp. xm-v-201]
MKTSLQFFKDMGVCDGAYAVLERVFAQAGVTEFDYAAGYEMMLGMMDQLEADAAQSGEPGHDTAQGWLEWCYELRKRPEAIMYFGDHIEEDLFRTADGQLHETLEAARDHDRCRYAELRENHAAARVINGVRFGEGGAETWEVVDPAQDDLEGFDAFVWHDSTTGLNHRTDSAAEAASFDAAQATVLDAIEAAERAARIERRITDESGVFSVWVPIEVG